MVYVCRWIEMQQYIVHHCNSSDRQNVVSFGSKTKMQIETLHRCEINGLRQHNYTPVFDKLMVCADDSDVLCAGGNFDVAKISLEIH